MNNYYEFNYSEDKETYEYYSLSNNVLIYLNSFFKCAFNRNSCLSIKLNNVKIILNTLKERHKNG